jgi:hypothetical protein
MAGGAESTRREKESPGKSLLHRVQVKCALLGRPELLPSHSHCFDTPLEETTMRWKISHHGHDPRQIDLLAVIALIILIIAAWRYFESGSEPPNTTAFIVPSQSTHW